ncbi:MAG: hypothetical protein HKN31_10880 [Pricia sp.]|nr:hypothetical protein [Pricia sp.]
MKQLFLASFLMVSFIGMAQEQLNDYKYIIVPKKFEGFKRANQYQTSTLIKYLFSENGFSAVYEDELPDELNNDRCLGLLANLIDDSSMFTTKTTLTLDNCRGDEVFSTEEGKSKEKDYKDAYAEALRNAFTSFQTVNYAYNGKAEISKPITVSFKNDVKKMDEVDKKASKPAKNKDSLVRQEATLENQSYEDKRPISSNFKKAETNRSMVEQEATQEVQSYKNTTPISSSINSSETKGVSKDGMGTLYAQELDNGYQLVDSTPKIRLKIFETSKTDFYLAEGDGKNGVVYQQNGKWIFEYYAADNLITEELQIKF